MFTKSDEFFLRQFVKTRFHTGLSGPKKEKGILPPSPKKNGTFTNLPNINFNLAGILRPAKKLNGVLKNELFVDFR